MNIIQSIQVFYNQFKFRTPAGFEPVEDPWYQRSWGMVHGPYHTMPEFKIIGEYNPTLLITAIQRLLARCPESKETIRMAIYPNNQGGLCLMFQLKGTKTHENWMALCPKIE